MDNAYLRRLLGLALWGGLLLASAWFNPAWAEPPTHSSAKLDLLSFVDNEDGSYTLDWYLANPGDYDQNGEVNIADISALGGFLQKVGPFDPKDQDFVVDGDGNGEININDLTPIGASLGNSVIEYLVYVNGSEWLTTVPLSTGTKLAEGRLQFSVTHTPLDPPVSYKVVPSDGTTEGIPTELLTGIEPPKLSWAHTWGGAYPEAIHALATDQQGRCLAVGQVAVPGNGYDALLLIYDAAGELEQSFSAGGPGFEAFYAICSDGRGGWRAAGTTTSFGAGRADCLWALIDESFQFASMKTWGGPSNEVIYDMVIDPNRNIYLAGYSDSFGAGSVDGLLLRLNGNGGRDWSKVWGGTERDVFTAVAYNPVGRLVVGGTTNSIGEGADDALFAELSLDGGLMMSYAWGGPGHDQVRDIAIDANGALFATGTTELGLGSGDTFVLKQDIIGLTDGWAQSWGGYDWEGGSALLLDSAGGIIVAGTTASFSGAAHDLYYGRFSPTGVPVWMVRWGSGDFYNEGLSSLAWGPLGELILGGYTTAQPVAGQLEWENLPLSGMLLFGKFNSRNLMGQTPHGTETQPNISWEPIVGASDTPGGSQNAVVLRTAPLRDVTPH